MIISFVLRLVADPLAEGVTVGHVQAVDTGQTAVVRDLDGLVAFLRTAATYRTAGAGPGAPPRPVGPATSESVDPAGPVAEG